MAPEVTCCVPVKAPFPSGYAWVHSRYCPVEPRRKIIRSEAERHAVAVLERRHTLETASKGVVTREPPTRMRATLPHKACLAAFFADDLPCTRCQWLLGMDSEGSAYVDAHLD